MIWETRECSFEHSKYHPRNILHVNVKQKSCKCVSCMLSHKEKENGKNIKSFFW